jgi:hypothetical protein
MPAGPSLCSMLPALRDPRRATPSDNRPAGSPTETAGQSADRA